MLASTDVKTLCALLKASIATSVNFSELAIQIFCARFRLTLSWRQCAVEVCHHKFFVVAFCFQSSKNKPARSVEHKINFAWPSVSLVQINYCIDKVVHLPL